MSSELVPRASIEAIVAHRDRAMALYAAAFEKIAEAAAAVDEANAAVTEACGGFGSTFHEPSAGEVEAFRSAVKLPDAAQYARVARRLTDLRVWSSLVERTDLEHLMDRQAKEELRSQMAYVPEEVGRDGAVINQAEIDRGLPPVTVEAVQSTLEGFRQDAGTIWRRGIANAFAALDRRFRSHDGFKIGHRVVLSYAFDGWGMWNYHRSMRDTITDVERVFLVLDGKGPRASYAGIIGTIEEERRGGSGPRQSEHEGDYFRVRVFKNGNAHLWFTRKDLLAKVNKLLAEHYGEVLGSGKSEAAQAREAEVFEKAVARAPAKRFGFYPTPDKLADLAVEEAHLYRREGDAPPLVLEPSAGTGNLARRARAEGARVDVVEVQPHLVEELRSHGYRRVTAGDFLKVAPNPIYDAVVMNPPFDLERDVEHVHHALGFLKPDGRLVAIMSAGAEWRESRKAKALRARLEAEGSVRWRDLPAGSFADQGTHVNTVLLTLQRRAR